MLEEDKGSREKIPSTEAILVIFLHSSSTVILPSSHTALVIRRNGHTLLRVMTGNHSCILGIISPEAAHSQTVASGFGHRGARDSQGENLQQTCCEQIR